MNKQISLRPATPTDAPKLLEIYAPYVTDSVITFEQELPDLQEFKSRIKNTLTAFPYYVALVDGEIAGYAYASSFRSRTSYDWTAETTVYIHEDYHGFGLGKRLYTALEETLKSQGIVTMIACIAHPNPPSTLFHQAMGFSKVGHFTKCGYKMGQWIDVVWMEKYIQETYPKIPIKVIPFPSLAIE